MSFSKEDVLQALSHVIDPDFNKDLVSLNMIRNVEINGNQLSFSLVLTTPACPLKDKLKNDCLNAIAEYISPDVQVDVDVTSDVTSVRNANVNVLPSVKNIICVASGKGGVGKSTISVNLAISLAKTGAKVGLIDADIHGPSIPQMLDLKGQRPNVRQIKDKYYILPIEKHGIKVVSIGFLVDERQALVWRGPMVASALRQFVTDVIWGKLDYLIVDMPPGTGDTHLTMVQTLPVTGALIVTTPQEVAVSDARKAISMFRMDSIKVPVLGVIENMAYFSPPELPDNKYYLFGKGGGQRLADEYEIPFIGQVPIREPIMQGGEDGTPISSKEADAVFLNLAEDFARQVAIRNAQQPASEVVETSVE